MILGIGTDMVRIARMERPLTRPHFMQRVFTPEEREILRCSADPMQWAAGRWAAKEAVAKAMGCGLSGCPLEDVSILPDAKGAPQVHLNGRARERLRCMGGSQVWISIAHEAGMALAVAVVEGCPDGET